MNRRRKMKKILFLCVLALSFDPISRAQDKSGQANATDPQAAKAKVTGDASEESTTEALQKATQNPVASLISVPVQNNNNFGVNPGYRTQDVLNIQPVNSRDGRIRLGRHVAHILHIAQEARKVDLGSRTSFPVAHSNKHVSGAGKARTGAVCRCADSTWPLDFGGSCKQCMVGRRLG
jgi:hypothetical protein